MHKEVPLLSSCMKGYCQKNVIFCYFLPTSALFQKTFSIKWHSLRKSHANFRHVASRGKSYAIFIDSSPIRWKFCSLKFWSAFLINLEKQLVVNTDFMKKKRIKLWYFESLNGIWWIKYLGLVVVWSVFRNKGHCNFLLTSALFQKEVLNKNRCVFSISFEEVTCKVSNMSLQGKKRHAIFINSSPIGWKVLSVKFCSVFLTCARECFMENIVFAKAYMTSFLPRAV